MSGISLDIETVLAQLENYKETLSLELESVSLPLTNLNKIFWPATGDQEPLTKRDYIIYLAKVSSYVIPHLRDRLITLVRFPNGINEGRFYQKHWDFTVGRRRKAKSLSCINKVFETAAQSPCI
jgi:hypothetical protein